MRERAPQLYNVHLKRYTEAQAREHLAELLNAAEHGQPVIIERRGVRFNLETERARRGRRRRASLVVSADPAVTAGKWSWTWGKVGVRFS